MWRRVIMGLLICLFLQLPLGRVTFAKEWQGIIPLRSTREDVRKKFGKPSREHELEDTYDIKEDQVKFWYATEPCLGLTYYWGNYGVLPGTILTITVHYDYDKAIPLADLNIPNIEEMKREVDSSNTIYYFDKEQCIEYSVQEGKVVAIEYGPQASDSYLRCSDDN